MMGMGIQEQSRQVVPALGEGGEGEKGRAGVQAGFNKLNI